MVDSPEANMFQDADTGPLSTSLAFRLVFDDISLIWGGWSPLPLIPVNFLLRDECDASLLRWIGGSHKEAILNIVRVPFNGH
jgi:hypothetical protein